MVTSWLMIFLLVIRLKTRRTQKQSVKDWRITVSNVGLHLEILKLPLIMPMKSWKV